MTGSRGISPPKPPISALPHRLPPAGLSWGIIRREPAIAGLDWPFTPSPGSRERIARQHPYRASIPLLRDFTLPRARSTGFGSHPSDSGRFHTPSLGLRLRTCRFPCGFGADPLNLAARVNSLPRDPRRTVQPRSPPLVLPCHQGFLRGGSTLSGRTLLSPPGFRLFSPPARGAFQLSLTVLVRYRSRDVFRVGSRCLPASRRISDRRYSGTPQELGGLRLRGFHPLRRRVLADFGFAPRAPSGTLQHHIPSGFPRRVQFALCRFRSPLLTASLLLSFPAGTKMFQFPAFPLPTGSAAKPREVPFGHPRFDGCLRLAGAYRSLPRPSSAPRAEPSTRRLSCHRAGRFLDQLAYARPS